MGPKLGCLPWSEDILDARVAAGANTLSFDNCQLQCRRCNISPVSILDYCSTVPILLYFTILQYCIAALLQKMEYSIKMPHVKLGVVNSLWSIVNWKRQNDSNWLLSRCSGKLFTCPDNISYITSKLAADSCFLNRWMIFAMVETGVHTRTKLTNWKASAPSLAF